MLVENATTVLSVRSLTANIGDTQILKGLDLEIKAESIYTGRCVSRNFNTPGFDRNEERIGL